MLPPTLYASAADWYAGIAGGGGGNHCGGIGIHRAPLALGRWRFVAAMKLEKMLWIN